MISQEAMIPNIIKTPAKSYFDCITHKAANEYFTDIFKVSRRCNSIPFIECIYISNSLWFSILFLFAFTTNLRAKNMHINIQW